MDAERVALALGVEADELGDVARREAARRLRLAAEQLDDPSIPLGATVDLAHGAGQWLLVADEFDRLWESQHPEGEGGDDTEATKPPKVAAATEKRSQVEDWSA
jgi:hypothetical protein